MRTRCFRWNRRHGALAVLLLAALLTLAACYPGGPEDLGDIGVALTFFDQNADFSGLRTYAMDDTVIALINPDDDSSRPLNRIYDPVILAEIQAQMAARGFVREMDPETNPPDVGLFVGATQNDAYILFRYWAYPPGWWGPGWGWGYPPSTGAVRYKEGSIIWFMADVREAGSLPPGGEVPVIWQAAINGALDSSDQIESGIQTGIRQCFTQSPYIRATEATR